MQATSRRDPKKFAQRTMAAAIAASALAAFGAASHAQTTGGGVGAAVNGNANASAGQANQGTAGAAGGAGTSGVAVPNAPSSPVRPGAGPGINNTGSPVLPLPGSLRTPIGGASGGPRGPNGTSRLPGNTLPQQGANRNPGLNNRAPNNNTQAGNNGAQGASNQAQPNGTSTNDAAAGNLPGINGQSTGANRGNTNQQSGANRGAAGTTSRRPGAHMRTGTISNFTDSTMSFREGANTSTLNITPNTVVQMDGRNISMRDIPANSQVRVERSPSNANEVQRVVVVPQAARGAASSGGTSVNTQTGTGSTGSANRSLPNNDLNAPTGNASTPNNDINAGTGNASTPSNDINAGTGNASTPNNDLNSGTRNASTPGNDINSPTVNSTGASNRPLAPGQNPADQPLAPFSRGSEQRLQAGFDETNSGNTNQQNRTPAKTDSSQFLGPATGNTGGAPASNPQRAGSRSAVRARDLTLPNNDGTSNSTETTTGNASSSQPGAANGAIRRDPNAAGRAIDSQAPGGPDRLFETNPSTAQQRSNANAPQTGSLNDRLGMQMSTTREGLTVGNVTERSIAARSGLRSGDRIQSINGQSISSSADFNRAFQAGNFRGAFNASVLRNGQAQDISLALPNGFFDGVNANGASGANSIGTLPALGVGGGVGIAADGTPGVNVGGVFVPTEGAGNVGTNQGGAAAAATAGVNQRAEQPAEENTDRTAGQQGQAPIRVRPQDPPVGTQRSPVTTEALKIPEVDLGWQLKATPEGVVASSTVDDGLAATSKFESGDLIESIDGRPVTAPGAVSYELHRHRAGTTVDVGIMRGGRRMTQRLTLPKDHQPMLLNRNESFGAANNAAKEQGGSGARPIPVKPTEESRKTVEEENRALREQVEELRGKQKP